MVGTECKPGVRYGPSENGRTGEIRTRDQRIKSPLLYRLSYRPILMALQNDDPRFYWIACCQKKRLLVTFSPANPKLEQDVETPSKPSLGAVVRVLATPCHGGILGKIVLNAC